jgi:hypothetical protein
MQHKQSGRDTAQSFFERLYEQGGARVNKVLEDLLSRPHVTDRLGKTVGRAADAKRQIDRNMQLLLSLLNLPSRADYNRLLAKIETLQGSLVNLSMKLDRVLAAQERAAARPVRRARKKARTTHAAHAAAEPRS